MKLKASTDEGYRIIRDQTVDGELGHDLIVNLSHDNEPLPGKPSYCRHGWMQQADGSFIGVHQEAGKANWTTTEEVLTADEAPPWPEFWRMLSLMAQIHEVKCPATA